jgi:hypothetical protein
MCELDSAVHTQNPFVETWQARYLPSLVALASDYNFIF